MKLTLERIKENLDDWALDYMPAPIYRIPSRIMDFFRKVKSITQKITRSHHTSDVELWNLSHHLVDIILPKLKAFREMERMGYPAGFEEYDEKYFSGWSSREEYEKAIADGKIEGGGAKRWEKILDEMIFAFEFSRAEEDKCYKKFVKKYGYDWHEEKPENKITHKWYKNPETGHSMSIHDEDEEPGAPWVKDENGFLAGIFSRDFYYDIKLHQEAGERAQRGFELFGKYFMNLWD